MTATVTLARPIEAHGTQVTALVFREPCARDLKDFRIGDATAGNWIPLIAALAGIPPSSVEAMHPADLFAAIEAIGPLFLAPPAIGAIS